MTIRILPLRAALALCCFALTSLGLRAGTPLICHPYEIGDAKTLPGGPMKGTSKDYDRANLARDTLDLLRPETPIIVRMETLRRAAIYATSDLRVWKREHYTAQDLAVARGLFDQLQARAKAADTDAAHALALFDAGFFAETVRHAQLDLGVDGYPLLLEAQKLRAQDAEIEFALALASSWPKQRDAQGTHLASARAQAKPGTLLATNLASHFGR